MVSVSVDPESAQNGLELSRDYDCIYPTVGIHPLYHEAFDQIDEIGAVDYVGALFRSCW